MSTKLQVDIVADARGVGPGVNEAESRFSKLGSTIGKVGRIAATGLAVGLGLAAAGAVKLAQGAIEDEAAAAKLAGALERTTGATRGQIAAVEDWITAQGKAKGVADDELRPAIERLASSTGSIEKAQRQATLAMDISAARGVSLETVTKALERANNGTVTSLGKLGVSTKDAAGETKTLDQLTQDLARTYGGAASDAANTTAGRWNRLKLRLSEAGETIGGKLIPVADKLAGWALRMAPRAEQLGETFAKRVGPALSRVGDFITDKVVPAGQRLYSWYVEKIAPGIAKAVTPVMGALRSGLNRVSGALDDNQGNLRKFGDWVQKVAEFIADPLMPWLGKFVGFLVDKLFSRLSTAVDWFSKLVGWIDDAAGAISDLVGWIGRIDFPDAPGWLEKAGGWLTGSVGGLSTMTTRLTGGGPSYGGGGLATAAASMLPTGWASLVAGTAGAGAAGYVDARTFLTVQVDGSGVVDENRVAAAIAAMLARYFQRLGRPVTDWRPFGATA